MTKPLVPRSPRSVQALAILAFVVLVFGYPFFFRIHRITQDFHLMNDQIRDWDLVQTSFRDLPVIGTPRTGGGHHVGPAYYHWLWLSRVALSPWFENLPHVGGFTVSLADAAGFLTLAVGLWRSNLPLGSALGLGLLAATNPYEAGVARAGWNPSFSLAMANLSLGSFLLWRRYLTLLRAGIVMSLAWIAIEGHTAAFPVAVSLFAVLLASQAKRGRSDVLALIVTTVLIVSFLEIPALLSTDSGTAVPTPADGPSALTRSLATLAQDPGSAFSLRGLDFVVWDASALAFRSTGLPPSVSAVVVCAALVVAGAGLVTATVDKQVAAIGLLPVALAAIAFTVFDEPLQPYWLMPILGAYWIVVASSLLVLQRRAPRVGDLLAALILLAAIATQPRRWSDLQLDHRYPLYATVVRAARQIASERVPIRSLQGPADGRRPTTSTPVVRWLGGIVSHDSPIAARIRADGAVEYSPAP
jgi:hypothetical protein